MALSDTCAEALERLKTDIVDYANWDYPPTELSRIINAMYELATFMVVQDLPPKTQTDVLNEIVDGVVVASILDKAHKEKTAKFLPLISSIAKVNSRLSASIDVMVTTLTSQDASSHVNKDPRLLDQLKEIQRLKAA